MRVSGTTLIRTLCTRAFQFNRIYYVELFMRKKQQIEKESLKRKILSIHTRAITRKMYFRKKKKRTSQSVFASQFTSNDYVCRRGLHRRKLLRHPELLIKLRGAL